MLELAIPYMIHTEVYGSHVPDAGKKAFAAQPVQECFPDYVMSEAARFASEMLIALVCSVIICIMNHWKTFARHSTTDCIQLL